MSRKCQIVAGLSFLSSTSVFAQVADFALNRQAFATTVYSQQFGAGQAVDGNVSTGWSPASGDLRSSLKVDLGQAYVLGRVQLVTRQDLDQGPESRSNFEIVGANAADLSDAVTLCSQAGDVGFAQTYTCSPTSAKPFRYLAARKTADGYFFITELRAYQLGTNGSPQGFLYAQTTGNGTSCSWVSPCSLSGAQILAERLKQGQTTDLVVRIGGGTYPLASTLSLTGADSGENGYYVVYEGDPSTLVSLSGGQAVSGWTSSGNGVYQASVASGLQFRNLYNNGARMTRARTEWRQDASFDPANKTITISKSLANVTNLDQVELVSHLHWQQHRLHIATFTPGTPQTSNIAVGTQPTSSSNYPGYPASLAVDGNDNTGWSPTGADPLPRLSIDLGQPTLLSAVKLVTRQDYDQSTTRQNFVIQVANAADFSDAINVCSVGATPLAFQQTLTCSVQGSFRYLAAAKTVSEYFYIAELEAITNDNVSGQVITPTASDAANTFGNGGGTANGGGHAYYLENSLAFLDSPTEWYRDKNSTVVYFEPPSGQAPTNVVVPSTQTLLRVGGTAAAPANHIKLRNITFEYSSWLTPSAQGFAQLQATIFEMNNATTYGYVPGGLEVDGVGTNNIVFERNTFRHMGASALVLQTGVNDCSIVGNTIYDVSAEGISLDNNAAPTNFQGAGNYRIVVSNNAISDVGNEYDGSVGIYGAFLNSATIQHNTLTNLPYTGISVGLGWTNQNSPLGNNNISFNRISAVMQTHDDGGGIYTISKQPGGLISQNYLLNVNRGALAETSPIAGIYLDNGTEGVTVSDNVIQNVSQPINVNIGGIPAQNNTFSNNAGSSQTTIDNSGVQPPFKP